LTVAAILLFYSLGHAPIPVKVREYCGGLSEVDSFDFGLPTRI